jgi:hypothetical protein
MSNNPISFVDPDGGSDWWDRNGVTYFVDGMQVDYWEFKSFMQNPTFGTQMEFIGTSFALMSAWGNPTLTFQKGRGWGHWIDFSVGEISDIEAERIPKGKDKGEGTILGDWSIGSKFFRRDLDNVFRNAPNGTTAYNRGKSPGEIKTAAPPNAWAKLKESGFVGGMVYDAANGLNIFTNGMVNPSQYYQNLDNSLVEKGSQEYAFLVGMMTFAPGPKGGKGVSKSLGVVEGGLDDVVEESAKGGYINLASSGRTAHIIAGDATGGGHAWFGSLKSFANGLTGSKSMFPATWSNSKIMHAVSDVAVNNQWIQQTGKAGAMFTKSGQPVRFVVEGTYQGRKIRVITTHTDIITAFPIK